MKDFVEQMKAEGFSKQGLQLKTQLAHKNKVKKEMEKAKPWFRSEVIPQLINAADNGEKSFVIVVPMEYDIEAVRKIFGAFDMRAEPILGVAQRLDVTWFW